MPYIIRDSSGNVTRASVQAIHGSEGVPYEHPDLIAFLEKNGQNPQDVENALEELRRTDAAMSRAVEDVVMALLKKNILKMNDLPAPLQDRMSLRVKLRCTIQESLNKATNESERTAFSSSSDEIEEEEDDF